MNSINLKEMAAEIAKNSLFIDTLDERGLDDLDFHEVNVELLERALIAAFAAGYVARDNDIKIEFTDLK